MSFHFKVTEEIHKKIIQENLSYPKELVAIPEEMWPPLRPFGLTRVWRSRKFSVQEYKILNMPIRLSINRNELDESLQRWADGITWDEIQQIKHEVGYGEYDAVEIYPADKYLVNDANMRHIWIMDEPIEFAWKAKNDSHE